MDSNDTSIKHCHNCGKDNTAISVFCIFCGFPLLEDHSETEHTDGQGEHERHVQALENELREVTHVLSRLTERLTALEQLNGPMIGSAPRKEPVSPTIDARPEGGQTTRIPHSSRERLKPGLSWADWERLVGLNWLAIVGAAALVIGTGFFLGLAIENQWIGETGQVIIGIVAGLILLGAGEYSARRYPAWAQAVTGSSIAILYLSIYAAFGFYNLIDPLIGFTCLALVVALSGLLALRYESKVIAILGIFGAFLTPVLLSSILDSGHYFLLLAYILLVDVGILVVSAFRNWRWFTLVGMLASYAVLGNLPSLTGINEMLWVQAGLTGVFLTFVGATTLFHVVWRNTPKIQDMSLMILNGFAYYAVTLNIWDEYQEAFGLMTLGLSLFYGLVGYISIRRSGTPYLIVLFSLAIALVFLTIAIPLQLSGSWVTVAWAAEGAVLMLVGFVVGNWRIRAFSLAVLAIVGFRMLFFDAPVWIEDFQLFLNDRFPIFLACIAAFYVATYLYWKGKNRIQEWEKNVVLVLAATANLFTLWALSAEVISYFDSLQVQVHADFSNSKQLTLTILWAIYAIGVVGLGIVRQIPTVRLVGIAILAIPVLKLFTFDVFLLEREFRVIAFITLGVLLLAAGFAYHRYSKRLKEFLIGKPA
ncbi:DUF2339 domain-containing protein [Dehalococcoidia bacterium]|nr:DUF2339 domain-containing protein [Dehalococcoidia bacterium]